MQNSMPRSESGHRRNAAAGSAISSAFIALLPVLACFLGGATEKWAEGIVVAILGFYLFVRPPRFSLGVWTNLVFVAFLALSVIAFLPAGWFFQPAWRASLVNDFAIQISSDVT